LCGKEEKMIAIIRQFTIVFSLCTFSLLLASTGPGKSQEKPMSDPWEPIRFMAGQWEGTAEGKAGSGRVERTYAFVLKERYLHERNVSTYTPQEKNKAGEVHEHWSFFSYDRFRKKLVLRQFHQEGFVNRYVYDAKASNPKTVVFISESFENFDNAWKARETYEIRSPDEFVETFELAPPGGAFEVYSRNHFKRAKSKGK
jgi:hypothetical protein